MFNFVEKKRSRRWGQMGILIMATTLLCPVVHAADQLIEGPKALIAEQRVEFTGQEVTGSSYASKLDFAELEHEFSQSGGLTAEMRATLTPEDLDTWGQERLDQFYALLTSGPIPQAVQAGEGDGQGFVALQANIIVPEDGPLKRNVHLNILPTIMVEGLGETFWRGKRVNKEDRASQNNLRSMGLGWRAPAKIYCGISMVDSRRESIIFDYHYNDTMSAKYRIKDTFLNSLYTFVDNILNRHGLSARNEVRMVRPGFYLGRAYLGRLFVFNFTLYNRKIDQNAQKAIFDGDQQLAKKYWQDSKDGCWNGERQKGLGFPEILTSN